MLAGGEYEFEGHSRQSGPNSVLYLPESHALQVAPFSALPYPALHVQAAIVVLTAGDTEFAGHNEHASEPSASLYVPARHSRHGPFVGPVYPA
jgi:hypothetical protein